MAFYAGLQAVIYIGKIDGIMAVMSSHKNEQDAVAMHKPHPDSVLSDLSAHSHAMEIPMRDVVRQLSELLGATTVAAIGGVSETRAVQEWMAGREPQRPHVLRFALQLATMIAAVTDGELARAWFHGSNPHLDDAVPALLLRNAPLNEIQSKLMAAARAFAARA